MTPIKLSLLAPKGKQRFHFGQVNDVEIVDTMGQLTRIVTNHHWAPGTFNLIDYTDKNDNVNRGMHRAIYNCTGVDLLAFDVDEGRDLTNARADFADYKHIIVTSRSHQKIKKGKKCDRFRVILFLSKRIIDNETYLATWLHYADKWNYIDPQCKDISRFYYAGNEVISVNEGGKLVEPVLPSERPTNTNKSNGKEAGPQNTQSKGLGRATLNFMLNLSQPGTIHGTMVKALHDFRENGYSLEDALAKFENSFETNGLDWGVEEIKRVKDIYSRESKHPPRWPALIKTKDGKFRPDPKARTNYAHLFGQMGFKPRYNQLEKVLYLGSDPITDLELARICNLAMEEGLLNSKDIIMNHLHEVGEGNSFHPLRAAIEGAPNGKDHIAELLNTIEYEIDTNSEEPEADQIKRFDSYIEKWLVGCVAKLYRPGSQNLTLVFYGAQGIGKSRWLEKLGISRRAFGEGSVDPGNKDHELRHLTHFIWHIPELESVTSKRESGALKDYLTKSYITVRPAYGRNALRGYSLCNFCASVNQEQFLTDWTGNRRFLTVPIRALDHTHKINIAAVFKQAKELLDNDYQYWLDIRAQEELNKRSDRFTFEHPIDDIVNKIVGGDEFMTAHEIFDAFDFRPKPTDFTQLASKLAKKGIPKSRQRTNGYHRRGYLIDKTSL